MVKSDRGGLIMQPPVGVFPDVAILDFSSMMASIMIEFNVSPETAGAEDPQALDLPELGVKVGTRLGLMPEALRPLRDKRLKLKRLLKTLDPQAPHYHSPRRRNKAVVDALKWLTVVAYGRLGFANSTFGRINAHEVVSLLSRKVITRAKLVDEERGFRVLHLYVDSLFVSCPGASAADFLALAQAIEPMRLCAGQRVTIEQADKNAITCSGTRSSTVARLPIDRQPPRSGNASRRPE